MNQQRPRGTIEAQSFATSKAELLDSLGEQQRVLDDLFPSFDYVIAWNPKLYPEVVRGSGVHWFNTRPGLLPSLSIWYAYDDEDVTFLYIERYTDGEEDADS